MFDIVFVISFLIVPFFAFLFMHVSKISILEVSIPSFLILSMFLYAYIGILVLYFGWDDYRYSIGIQDRQLIFRMLVYSSWSIIGLILGFVYARAILRAKSVTINSRPRPLKKREVFFTLLAFMLCSLVLILYLKKLSSIAIVVAFLDGIKDAGVARSSMANDFSGKYHWYSVFMHDLMNVVTFTLFSNWLVTKNKSAFIFFSVSFLFSAFAVIMTTEKGPFAWLVIGLYLVYCLSVKNGKMNIKALMKLFIIIILTLVVFYILLMGSNSFTSALGSVISRAFTGGISTSYFYLEFFPNHHDFLFGRSFPNPGGMLPFDYYALTVEIMKWKFPGSGDVVGSAPTVFWGEMYANFGIYGILMSPFFIGVGVYFIAYFFNRLENTPLKVGFMVWLILHYRTIASTSLSGFMLDLYLFVVGGAIALIIAFSNKLVIKLRSISI